MSSIWKTLQQHKKYVYRRIQKEIHCYDNMYGDQRASGGQLNNLHVNVLNEGRQGDKIPPVRENNVFIETMMKKVRNCDILGR